MVPSKLPLRYMFPAASSCRPWASSCCEEPIRKALMKSWAMSPEIGKTNKNARAFLVKFFMLG
jgi:hypothetical protein